MHLTGTATPQSTTGTPRVSLNDEMLAYDRPNGRDRALFSRLPQPLTAAAAIIMVLAVAGLFALTATAVGANEGDAKIKAVHFDLTAREAEASGPLQPQGSENPARYRSLVVEYGGLELGLEPLTGAVNVTLSQDHSPSFTAELDGLRIGSAAPDFADSLADGAGSADVQRFVSLSEGAAATIDLAYSRPLGVGDFLLVQELNGDAQLVLTGLDADGAAVGQPITVGPTYQWNTGHGDASGALAWASAVPVERFGAGEQAMSVLRISGADAQFKVVALGPAAVAERPTESAAGDGTTAEASADTDASSTSTSSTTPTSTSTPTSTPASDGSTDDSTEAAVGENDSLGGAEVAAVGVEVKIQTALAVDGAGCTDAPDQSEAGVTTGQPATYCFVVTNEGTTHLDDVTITDQPLGLESASLPRVDGQGPIAPGDQAVYYHHGSVPERASDDATVATARPIAADGGPVEGLISAPVATAASSDQDGPTKDEAPAVLANVSPDESAPVPAADDPTPATSATGDEPVESLTEPPAQLALTGMVTEPWVIVVFAMAFIFIGYTVYAAFAQQSGPSRSDDGGRRNGAKGRDGNQGHSQLDALGFD